MNIKHMAWFRITIAGLGLSAAALGMLPARIANDPLKTARAPEAIRAPNPGANILGMLEQELPFHISVGEISPSCSGALDVELWTRKDPQGGIAETRWRVMDRGSVQWEGADFYELYHRCDAPSCLNVRLCREAHTEASDTERIVHVCLD